MASPQPKPGRWQVRIGRWAPRHPLVKFLLVLFMAAFGLTAALLVAGGVIAPVIGLALFLIFGVVLLAAGLAASLLLLPRLLVAAPIAALVGLIVHFIH
jgi:hypothetical protein